MALHTKDAVREVLLDDVHASTDMSIKMPKYKIPRDEALPRHAYTLPPIVRTCLSSELWCVMDSVAILGICSWMI